jgi:hypothetical protein
MRDQRESHRRVTHPGTDRPDPRTPQSIFGERMLIVDHITLRSSQTSLAAPLSATSSLSHRRLTAASLFDIYREEAHLVSAGKGLIALCQRKKSETKNRKKEGPVFHFETNSTSCSG